MQTKSQVTFLVMAMMCSLSTAGAQQTTDADTATSTAGPLSPPTAGEGRSSVYVYREGSMLGALGHPYVFVNDSFLAVMKKLRLREERSSAG